MNAGYKDSGLPVALRLRAQLEQERYRRENAAAFRITAGIRRTAERSRARVNYGWMPIGSTNWVHQARTARQTRIRNQRTWLGGARAVVQMANVAYDIHSNQRRGIRRRARERWEAMTPEEQMRARRRRLD